MKIPLVNLSLQYQQLAPEIEPKLIEIMKKGAFVLGEEVSLFEKEFAKFCETHYAIGVGSGTEAIQLALLAGGIKSGDEVITAANTFIATVGAIYWSGAKPVLVDVDEKNYNIDLNLIERAITPKTKAIVPVHLFGQPVDMDKLMNIAKKHNLLVIEDACQAHGATWRGKKVGSSGKIGAFSFYPAKNLGAYGDGGMIVTNDKKIADEIRMLRDHGQQQKYFHQIKGFNSRLDNIQAAILRIKLRHLNEWNRLRNEHAKLYTELLKDTSLITPYVEPSAYHVFHLYVVRSKKRDQLREFLKERGIGTGIHYPIPIHLSGAYKDLGYKKGDFPVTEQISQEFISLPMFPELKKEDIHYITNSIKKFERGI